MEKERASTHRFLQIVAAFGPLTGMVIAGPASASSPLEISKAEALRIGRRVWQNESGGTISGLTAWNQGENFASLGIGHFIWYPEGQRGPFEESFPKFVAFARENGASVAKWLNQACPWNSQTEFGSAQDSTKMKDLRRFLEGTIDLQAQFLVSRLEQSLTKMLEEAAPANRENVQRQFERLARTPAGCYALVDYVNFKGEGVLHTERYRGEGWGLLQVLEQMHSAETGRSAVREFSESAAAVLRRRVQNSPPERHESRWLPGWLNRVRTYSENS